MVDDEAPAYDAGVALLGLYDRALPDVYGYLLARCRSVSVAEDLTADTFLAAVTAVQRGTVGELTVAWLIGVARHKVLDHWRRTARDERRLRLVAAGEPEQIDDPWDEVLDGTRAHDALGRLGAHHRAALTLRYLDGLPVPEVAATMHRTVHATEALLVRARRAFREVYGERRDA